MESECKKIGLQLNDKTTKVMTFNTGDTTITTSDGVWIATTEHDLKIRRAQAWSALHGMTKVWKWQLGNDLKRRLFVATIESVLLYGAETWTLTVKQEKLLDGAYTRMLRMALNVSWQDHVRNVDLEAGLPRVSEKIRKRRMELASHCVRHPLGANSGSHEER